MALRIRSWYSTFSAQRCSIEIGSLNTTGTAIFDNSLPMFSFKIDQILLFVLGSCK